MIWVIALITGLIVMLILAPAFVADVPKEESEIADYFAQIDALDARDDMDAAAKASAKLQLERHILKARNVDAGGGGRMLAGIAAVCLIIFGGGLYAMVGQPTPPDIVVSQDDDLITQLEQRLSTDRATDPVGWALYARVLGSEGRIDEAVAAYDRSLALDDNPDVRAEAEALIARSSIRGPSQDDIDATAELTEAERAEMIRGMVDGLAARLEDDPLNASGWTRLIRARMVLGDREGAEEAVIRVRETFADRPAVADQIIRESGWED